MAAEFSHIAACAGADVTILQRGERLPKNFDSDLVDWLARKFARLGIEVETGTEVRYIETEDNELVVTARRGSLDNWNISRKGLDPRRRKVSLPWSAGDAVLAHREPGGEGPPTTATGRAATVPPPLQGRGDSETRGS